MRVEEEKRGITIGTYHVSLFYTALFSVLGYFVYGGVTGLMAMLALCLIYDLALYLSIIPFGGSIIQALVMSFLSRKLFAMLSIYSSWLTTCVFWCYLICGIIITIVVTAFVIANLDK